MDFVVVVVPSRVVMGHMVSIGSLDEIRRHVARSIGSGCKLKLL